MTRDWLSVAAAFGNKASQGTRPQNQEDDDGGGGGGGKRREEEEEGGEGKGEVQGKDMFPIFGASVTWIACSPLTCSMSARRERTSNVIIYKGAGGERGEGGRGDCGEG